MTTAPKQTPAERERARLDRIRAIVRRTRAEQGLPPTIQDPIALDRIAALLRGDPLPAPPQRVAS